MNETIGGIQKPDPEEYARIILYQLAALRAESIQTKAIVTQILCHQRDENHAHYIDRVQDLERQKAEQVDRIYRASLDLAKIPYKEIPSQEGGQ